MQDGWAEVETRTALAWATAWKLSTPSGNRTVQLMQMHAAWRAKNFRLPRQPLRVRIPIEGLAEGALIARL